MLDNPPVHQIETAKAAFLAADAPESRAPSEDLLHSWERSRAALGVPSNVRDVPQVSVDLLDSQLLDTFQAPLQRFAETLDGTGLGLLLADSSGRILQRWGDRTAEQHFERVGTMRGAVLAEDAVGTNGVGTVIASGNSVQIRGAEHYADFYSRAVCTGAPVMHPMTGRLLAVVTFSCEITPRSELLPPLLRSAVSQLEEHVLEVDQPATRQMMAAFLQLSRTRGEPVLALGPQGLVVQNSRASRLSSEELDKITRLCESHPSGGTQRVASEGMHIEVTPLGHDNHVVVVLDHREGSRAKARPRNLGNDHLVGREPEWLGAVRQVAKERYTGEPVVIAGEPSVGKLSMALGAPYGALEQGADRPFLDAGESHVLGAREWLQRLSSELDSGRRVVIRGVQSLDDHCLAGMRSMLERTVPEASVVLTMTPSGPEEEGQALAQRLAGKSVWVPALRERAADLPALWDALTESVTPGRRLVLRSDTLSVLRGHRWPGNLNELRSVVRALVSNPPRGPVAPGDLPESVRGPSSALSLIERVELEAIRQALAEADGNRARAAEILGISRATVYRKMKSYRLSD